LNSVAEKEKLLNKQNEEIENFKVRQENLERLGIIITILFWYLYYFYLCLEKELDALKTNSIEQEKVIENNRIELEVFLL